MIEFGEQLHYAGGEYLDSNMSVESYADLSLIPRSERFIGMTVTVLNATTTKVPQDYWLVNTIANSGWKLKQSNTVATYEALLSYPYTACVVGLEMMVQSDETNDGKPTKYRVTAIDTKAKTVTWEKEGGSSDNDILITGNDIPDEWKE